MLLKKKTQDQDWKCVYWVPKIHYNQTTEGLGLMNPALESYGCKWDIEQFFAVHSRFNSHPRIHAAWNAQVSTLKRCIHSSHSPNHYLIPLYFLPLQETLCLLASSPHFSSLPQLLTTTHPLPGTMDLSVLHIRDNTIIKYVLFLYSFPQ